VTAGPHTLLSQLPRLPSRLAVNNLRSRQVSSGTGVVASGCGGVGGQRAPETNSPQPAWIASESDNFVEETVARLWTKVLRIKPPTTTSNFFDIGGHSLLAAHLAAEISRAYRINFPVSLIFRGPTIKAIAQRLQGGAAGKSSVVSLQESGSLPPFFCGGSMPEFVDLSHALGTDQPFFLLDIFALQQQRWHAGEPPYTSIPDLATHFRRDLSSIHSIGPYLLGGMCEGGIVALEIALQLQAQALEVALLAEFDTPVNGYWRKRPVDWVLHGWSLIRSRRLVPRTRDHIRARMTPRAPPTPEEETYAHIVNVTWKAIREYRPKRPFDGEIHLFRSPRSSPWHFEDAGAGWDARASLGVRVHDVVGEHVGMFCEPLSQRIIADVIAQAHRHPTAK
jgi:thioesterase domain-containing protein